MAIPLMQFVILAQGRTEELMVDVDGAAPLTRTLRLVREIHPTALQVVIAEPTSEMIATVEAAETNPFMTSLPAATSVVARLKQVLAAAPRNHHLVVLRGDVVYSRRTIAKLGLRMALPLVFGTLSATPPTVYALSFTPMSRAEAAQVVDELLVSRDASELRLHDVSHALPHKWIDVEDYTCEVSLPTVNLVEMMRHEAAVSTHFRSEETTP